MSFLLYVHIAAIAFTVALIIMCVVNALTKWESKNKRQFYIAFAVLTLLAFLFLIIKFYPYL